MPVELINQSKPYFIKENSNKGLSLVKSIQYGDNATWKMFFDDHDLDPYIEEINLRGLALIVRNFDMRYLIKDILAELKFFAQLTQSDYFSYENMSESADGSYATRYYGPEGDAIIHEICPRIFRDIKNN